jgi:hypothetical protein
VLESPVESMIVCEDRKAGEWGKVLEMTKKNRLTAPLMNQNEKNSGRKQTQVINHFTPGDKMLKRDRSWQK